MDTKISIWQSDAQIIALLGKRIKAKRLLLNCTQEELAYQTGLSKLTIQKIEMGQGPKLESFIRILRFFGDLDKLDSLLILQNISPKELYQNRSVKPRARARKRA